MTPTSRVGLALPPRKRLSRRMMEVFAGFLSHTDHHIGRIIEFLRSIDELDNTIIMVISDNGASAEGGPTGHRQRSALLQQRPRHIGREPGRHRRDSAAQHFNHYPWGWTWAGNTPFRRWKRETYRGGVS